MDLKCSFTQATHLLPHRSQCTNAQHNSQYWNLPFFVSRSIRRDWEKQTACIYPSWVQLAEIHRYLFKLEVLTIIRVLGSETPLFNFIWHLRDDVWWLNINCGTKRQMTSHLSCTKHFLSEEHQPAKIIMKLGTSNIILNKCNSCGAPHQLQFNLL